MMIEFQCGNIVSDAQEVCGNRIIVSDELSGEKVVCAKCKQKVEIPIPVGPKREEPPRPLSPKQVPPSLAKRRKAMGLGRAGGIQDPFSLESSENSDPPSAANDAEGDYELADSRLPDSNTKFAMDLWLEEPASHLPRHTKSDQLPLPPYEEPSVPPPPGPLDTRAPTKKTKPYCNRCGAILDKTGKCNSCGGRPNSEKNEAPEKRRPKVALAGFQLWFVSTISEAIPFRVLELALHFAATLTAVAFTFATLMLASGGTKWLLLLLILVGTGFYIALVVQGHRLATQFDARLAWFQKPFWLSLLTFSRITNWHGYDSGLKGRVIIDKKGELVTDTQIPGLEGFKKCEVLDLEGTAISDNGLKHLQHHKHLRCLIVRKTAVTHDAVQRFQQSRRKTWIWY